MSSTEQREASRAWMLEQRKRRGEAMLRMLGDYGGSPETTLTLLLQDLQAAGVRVSKAYGDYLQDPLTRPHPEEDPTDADASSNLRSESGA